MVPGLELVPVPLMVREPLAWESNSLLVNPPAPAIVPKPKMTLLLVKVPPMVTTPPARVREPLLVMPEAVERVIAGLREREGPRGPVVSRVRAGPEKACVPPVQWKTAGLPLVMSELRERVPPARLTVPVLQMLRVEMLTFPWRILMAPALAVLEPPTLIRVALKDWTPTPF